MNLADVPLRVSIQKDILTMKKLKSTIHWHSIADVLPDGPATVLVALHNAQYPIWLGWLEDDRWHDVDGSLYEPGTVTHWADLPAKPFQP